MCDCKCNCCKKERQPVTRREAIAAARTRVVIDRARGIATDLRIVALANERAEET